MDRTDNSMNKFHSSLMTANLMLLAFMLLAEAGGTMFAVVANEVPAGFELLKTLGYVYALGYWLEADGRRRDFRWPYCRGIFLNLVWPLLIPYYLFKTRGARAFLTLLIFGAMYGLSMSVGLIAATLLVAPAFD